jgi:NTP pyrophosphatase (non-canonical NTP hydrolase)
LIHSEVTEAFEEYRSGKPILQTYYDEKGKPLGVASELADIVVRVADVCGEYGINLEAILLEKMAYNETRPYMHGGKVL